MNENSQKSAMSDTGVAFGGDIKNATELLPFSPAHSAEKFLPETPQKRKSPPSPSPLFLIAQVPSRRRGKPFPNLLPFPYPPHKYEEADFLGRIGARN